MIGLKTKLLAATFKLISYNLTVTGKEEEICQNAPRMEVLAESLDAGVQNNLCQNPEALTKEQLKSCWSGDPERLAWIMFTMGELESGYKENVHAGQCKTYECDPVYRLLSNGEKKFVYHKARTSWQLQKTDFITDQDWDNMVGTSLEATTIAATIVGKELTSFRYSCGSEKGAISMYATGRMCNWVGAKARLDKVEKNMNRAKNEDWVYKTIEKYNACFPDESSNYRVAFN